jgi:hypothetical protein
MSLDFERVDFNPHSWSSLIWTINGHQIFGATAISPIKWKRERVDGYGMGRSHAPRTYSNGKVSFENLKVKCYSDSVEAIRDYYASFAADRRSFTNPKLTHTIEYIEADNFNNKIVRLEAVSWVDEGGSHDESPDPLFEELEFKYLRCYINGKSPADEVRI